MPSKGQYPSSGYLPKASDKAVATPQANNRQLVAPPGKNSVPGLNPMAMQKPEDPTTQGGQPSGRGGVAGISARQRAGTATGEGG